MELEPYRLEIKVEPKHIDYLNRVFEGYDHLCVVSTLDPKAAVVLLRGFGKQGTVKRILRGLPFPVEGLE